VSTYCTLVASATIRVAPKPTLIVMVLPHLGKKTQEQSFTFNCHIKGRRKSFAVSISGTASVKELIQSINRQGGLTLDPDALERTDYWKVCLKVLCVV
jgi:hypothetical protein